MGSQELLLRKMIDIFGVLADVRCYPKSDRDSDMPVGRYVPLATKVQRSRTGSTRSPGRSHSLSLSAY
jgi:hypothetical protein